MPKAMADMEREIRAKITAFIKEIGELVREAALAGVARAKSGNGASAGDAIAAPALKGKKTAKTRKKSPPTKKKAKATPASKTSKKKAKAPAKKKTASKKAASKKKVSRSTSAKKPAAKKKAASTKKAATKATKKTKKTSKGRRK